jgi:hypothetical protein
MLLPPSHMALRWSAKISKGYKHLAAPRPNRQPTHYYPTTTIFRIFKNETEPSFDLAPR